MFCSGLSLIYFALGTTNLGSLALLTDNLTTSSFFISVGLIFTISAFLFKLGAAPYHMWIADVYEGAPSLISLIFAVVPKVAFFIVVLRVSYTSFWSFFSIFWEDFFCFCGVLSLFIGCICGLGEIKIKRLLAFSSVGHVGFLCLGLASGNVEGVQAVIFYLFVYMLTASFLWIYVLYLDLSSKSSLLTFADAVGLVRSNPFLGFGVALMIFSLAGIPPFGGFFAKFNIFIGLVDSSFYIMSIIAVVTSVISAFYYIRLIKIFYFEKTQNWFYFAPLNKSASLILVLSGLIVIFFIFSPNFLYLLSYKVGLGLMF